MRILLAPDKFTGCLSAPEVAAVFALTDLEPEPTRSIARAPDLLGEVGARLTREWARD